MPTLPKRIRDHVPFSTIQNPFYNSSAWRKFRHAYIKSNPLCIDCHKLGQITQADVVDHIIPIRQGGNPFDTNNLQPLCHYHHNAKSGRGNKERAEQTNYETR